MERICEPRWGQMLEIQKICRQMVRYSSAPDYNSSIKQNQNRLNHMDKAVFCFLAYPKFPLEVIVMVGDSVRQN
jgi:hypothetical protein